MSSENRTPSEQIRTIIATDCGSTTTKAILIELQGDEYRLMERGEAPTTVEAPFEDVTMGVRNAVSEIEELSGRQFLDDEGVITHRESDERGCDLYLSTSSAGGGLQMMVAGVVKTMTTESAERAALGAGAIVMDAIAVDDGRLNHEKVNRIRDLRPDMILLSGGIDGGTISHVTEIAELIATADPKPRLGATYQLPVIYAGNRDARMHIEETLGDKADLRMVDNLRPVLEREVLGPAREEIHNLFMEHVMAQAPGYDKLMKWTDAPIMPTPGAVGMGIQNVADQYDIEIIGVDIGGATTDIFSVFMDTFNRTVSANLGMSYSICNVLLEAGLDDIYRWLPLDIDPADLRNRIRNKMIRPTTIPHTLEELIVEQAIAREALRMALEHHKTLASGLKGVKDTDRDASTTFREVDTHTDTMVNMMTVSMVLGSGGALSHAPRRVQSALMMLDAFQPEGITELAVDSIFMMPQLGVLAGVHAQAAAQVFERDCLIRLGTVISPVQRPNARERDLAREDALTVTLSMPDGDRTESIGAGEMKRIDLPEDRVVRASLDPGRHWDIGEGYGRPLETDIRGGVAGIIMDARGRPLKLPEDDEQRRSQLLRWIEALDVYPSEALSAYLDKGREA